jgi:16S rRNA processing protein RimM
VLVGYVARPHGLAGEVVVDVYSDTPGRFAPGSALTARGPDGAARTVRVAACRAMGPRLLVRLDGVTTREGAEALRDHELCIPRNAVAPLPEGRHYRFELIGLTARTREGTAIGTVADVFGTGSNDVLVVRGDAGEILLPLLDSVLLEVSEERGECIVAVPPGLLDGM